MVERSKVGDEGGCDPTAGDQVSRHDRLSSNGSAPLCQDDILTHHKRSDVQRHPGIGEGCEGILQGLDRLKLRRP